MRELDERVCSPHAQDIWAVLPPGNSAAEIQEKTARYFDAGALQVWHHAPEDMMSFLLSDQTASASAAMVGPTEASRCVLMIIAVRCGGNGPRGGKWRENRHPILAGHFRT